MSGASPQSVTRSSPENLRQTVEELATRFDLPKGAADRLERFVRVSNWDHRNLVPDSAPGLPEPRVEFTEEQARMASNYLVEALSTLQVADVRRTRRMADVGSGAGFPGLVLAIALPKTRVTLVERHPHLSGYLRNFADDLGLKKVEVERLPVEEWTEGLGTHDLVTSRKMGRPNTILGWVAPLLAPGGIAVLFYKEREAEAEAMAAELAAANDLTVSEIVPVPATERRGRVTANKKHLHVFRKEGRAGRRVFSFWRR